MLKWLWLTAVVIVLDQASKLMADQMLEYHQAVPVIPFFNLTLSYNAGAAFSFLSDAGGWQRWFFIILALVVSVVLFFWLKSISSKASSLQASRVRSATIQRSDRGRRRCSTPFADKTSRIQCSKAYSAR